ncbi:MAG: hypothetical protein HYR76_07420 [Ignavibacteria bacterium]|nr:hypothetical protein [Ignavibacteria bacterium]MBI3766179.1 hypothetical protein [Ignavibacteriales bacterium]
MNKLDIALRILEYVVVSIGTAMVVVGFLNNEDLLTFFGVFLVIVLFFIYHYIQSAKRHDKTPVRNFMINDTMDEMYEILFMLNDPPLLKRY